MIKIGFSSVYLCVLCGRVLPLAAFDQLDLEIIRQLAIIPHAHRSFTHIQSWWRWDVDLRQSGVIGITRRPDVYRMSAESSDLDSNFPPARDLGQTFQQNREERLASAAG